MFWRCGVSLLLALGAGTAGCERGGSEAPPVAAGSPGGPQVPSQAHETTDDARAAILARAPMDHVRLLAETIGERNTTRPEALEAAAEAIAASFVAYGYEVIEQRYEVDGVSVRNLEARLAPREGTAAAELVVVGAHYDSARGSPGADDNASGVAVLLELARVLADAPQAREVVFVAFTNEEPPYFMTADMGSRRWAEAAVGRGERIVAMVSLESLGFYSDAPGSQAYPPLVGAFYPDAGNFLAVVGDLGSSELVVRVRELAQASGALPVESIAAPAAVTGIDWSDHASFWEHGVQAVMVTDTATFRNPHYHEASDLPGTLDEGRLGSAARAAEAIVRGLASP